jgi:hypothetical protein
VVPEMTVAMFILDYFWRSDFFLLAAGKNQQ